MASTMASAPRPALLGIDWGTTNRRAYLLARDGSCLARHADGEGLLAVRGGFGDSLGALRGRLGAAATVPVLMSGMVGSASGWQEVPYLTVDTPLRGLPARTVAVAGRHGLAIVPGYRMQAGAVDVMRGEEMQLLGALALGVDHGRVVLPGTHSKWAWLEGGALARFSTYMTGELFALLGKDGTLAALLADAAPDEAAFKAGLERARAGEPLTHSLFGARARVVTGAMTAAAARSWISGLLIGAEFAAQGGAQGARTVHIVASPALAGRYASAARHFGCDPVCLDPDAVYIAALQQFIDKA